jgi:YidC/Oxa1 family membrane protein insertase
MQQSMTYTFPLLTLFFGLKFPSGLALYWFLFSLWQLLSQYNTYGMGALKPWLKKLGLAKEPLGS